MSKLTPIRKLYIRGLHLAAMAAAYEAREALAGGNTAEWCCRSMHAAQLTEDARIVGGDIEALLDRTERVLEAGYLQERKIEREIAAKLDQLEADAIEGARMALAQKRLMGVGR